MKVVQKALSELHADPDNARGHDQKNLKAIMGSLQKFQQVEPLVVQKSSGKVIGGNGRLEAMKALGWETANVVLVDMDDQQAKALGLALNRTAELAQWKPEKLSEILSSLVGSDFDLGEIGFDEKDLKLYVGDDLDLSAATDEDPSGVPFSGGGDAPAPAAHVKMVQLFFSEQQHKEFMRKVAALKESEDESLSDTVFRAIDYVWEGEQQAAATEHAGDAASA